MYLAGWASSVLQEGVIPRFRRRHATVGESKNVVMPSCPIKGRPRTIPNYDRESVQGLSWVQESLSRRLFDNCGPHFSQIIKLTCLSLAASVSSAVVTTAVTTTDSSGSTIVTTGAVTVPTSTVNGRSTSYQTITVTDSSGNAQQSVIANVSGNKGGASEYRSFWV